MRYQKIEKMVLKLEQQQSKTLVHHFLPLLSQAGLVKQLHFKK
jgi:hypothetical protein